MVDQSLVTCNSHVMCVSTLSLLEFYLSVHCVCCLVSLNVVMHTIKVLVPDAMCWLVARCIMHAFPYQQPTHSLLYVFCITEDFGNQKLPPGILFTPPPTHANLPFSLVHHSRLKSARALSIEHM